MTTTPSGIPTKRYVEVTDCKKSPSPINPLGQCYKTAVGTLISTGEVVVSLPDLQNATDLQILEWALNKVGVKYETFVEVPNEGFFTELFDNGKSVYGYNFDRSGRLIK